MSNDPVGFIEQVQRGNSPAHGFNRYAYANNNPYKYIDPDGKYGRGSGFTDEEWRKFQEAQEKAASAMNQTAGNLRNIAEGLKDGETTEDGYSASDLNSIADSLEGGAKILNDDGSGGYIANAGETSNGNFAQTTVGGNTITIDTGHPNFGDGTIATAWAVGHESLHGVGLRDQTFLGRTAYRYGTTFGERRAFEKLERDKRARNPDHIMSLVFP